MKAKQIREQIAYKVFGDGRPFQISDIKASFAKADAEKVDTEIEWLVENGWVCRLPKRPEWVCQPEVLYEYDSERTVCDWLDPIAITIRMRELRTKQDASGLKLTQVERHVNKRETVHEPAYYNRRWYDYKGNELPMKPKAT